MNKTDLSKKEVFFLGIGGAFEPEFGNAALAVQHKNQKILIDCGYQVFSSMKLLSWFPDTVILTHLHNDHVGSLSSYIYYHYYVLHNGKLKIAYQNEAFLADIKGLLSYSIQELEMFVEFISIDEYSMMKAHETSGLHSKNLRSFAFEINLTRRYIFSGDLGDSNFIQNNISLQVSDLIFHDCSFYDKQKAHAFYKDLEKIDWPCAILGYHHNPFDKPNDCKIDLVYDSQFYPKPLFDLSARWKQK